jgi:hypothetical protein
MKLLSVAIVTLLSVIFTVLGQQDEVAKFKPREENDNSLRIARIIKGEIWQPLYIEDKKRRIMRRVFADGTQRDYIFTIFPDTLGLIPRWQVKGNYVYTVGMLPWTNQMGRVLLRAPIKYMVEDRTKEEERKMHGVIRSFPPYDMLPLTPLVPPTYPPGTKNEDMERWEDPDQYDLLVDDREILTLVITTGDKIDIWELDSQDAWSSMQIGGRQGVEKQWKRIASTTAPFKRRFVAEIEGGRLSLVSETGELWQSDDRKTFNKRREADNVALDGNSLIVVDTDQRQIWLRRDSTGKMAGDIQPHLIKGTEKAPSDRVLRAFEELSGAKPSLKK